MPGDTGFPRADVENDFLRARRRQVLARIAHRLRREPDDVNLILPFDEVVSALGWRGERSLGLQTIRLDTVVGSVDSLRDFDRANWQWSKDRDKEMKECEGYRCEGECGLGVQSVSLIGPSALRCSESAG